MSWIWGMKCPNCKQTTEGLHVDKTPRLRDWGLVCKMECGHHLGKGSYWLIVGPTIEEGWEKHCKSLGWDLEELEKE